VPPGKRRPSLTHGPAGKTPAITDAWSRRENEHRTLTPEPKMAKGTAARRGNAGFLLFGIRDPWS
jgi:hypothetical protein